jgi:hypothetical protein
LDRAFHNPPFPRELALQVGFRTKKEAGHLFCPCRMVRRSNWVRFAKPGPR